MTLIGMPEAAERMGVRNNSTAKTSMERAGVPLVRINKKAWGVEEADLENYIKSRNGTFRRGRPRKVQK